MGFGPDLLVNPAFVPCRDERCGIESLHAQHTVQSKQGRQCARCPHCNSKIIRAPRKWARCSSCSWNISVTKRRRRLKTNNGAVIHA